MILTIRRGVEADIPTLQALERDAAQAFRTIGYDFCADGPVRSDQEHERGLRDGAIFVAEVNAHPAGFILLWLIDGCAHITEVSVSGAFQKRGVGRALIEAAENWATSSGFNEITLTTFSEVAWNAPFYNTLGYRVFTPGNAHIELAAVQAEEAKSGFNVKPRVAMIKVL
ncbi:GNAT family N-acetyltransferase [Hyphococcus sp.]|uniref:GNAT family N-acetyltransferase n=1 Tax=Hyphococcus sp. TaxID=2038636 RepID=UPI0020856447|nr:MAG: N-acetyltransferase GCN5 [Marinicaulis sp.]